MDPSAVGGAGTYSGQDGGLVHNASDVLRETSILVGYEGRMKTFRHARTQPLHSPQGLSLGLWEDVLQQNNGVKQTNQADSGCRGPRAPQRAGARKDPAGEGTSWGRASRVTAGMREGSKREVLGDTAAVAGAEATGKKPERGALADELSSTLDSYAFGSF